MYNVYSAWQLSGPVDQMVLQLAFDQVLDRQQALRTRLQEHASMVGQHIDPASLRIDFHDLSQLQPEIRESERKRLRDDVMTRPFDLEKPPLIRVTLINLGNSLHDLLIITHHIVSDGWSMRILVRELTVCYVAVLEGREPQLPALPAQYTDYAMWQRDWLQGEELQRQLGYWCKQLADLSPLELPADRPRPAQMSHRGAMQRFEIAAECVLRLKALAREEHATLFMVLIAAFQTLLMRYSGQQDFAVGIPVAGRNRLELEGLVGFFVSTLVLRGKLVGNPSFRELIARTRETALKAYAHQDLPLKKLVEVLNPARDLSRSPLFQVMFSLQAMPEEALSLPGVEVQRLALHSGTAKFDLSLTLTEIGGRLEGELEYATDLFDAARIGRMVGHFLQLLDGLVAAPDTVLWQLPLLSEAERLQLLVDWNDTAMPYPRDSCIHALYESRAARTPEAVAVVCGVHALSYAELNTRANRLAHYLIGLGVGPDTLGGLCVMRSLDMLVGILGILKAGGAYLPLDPDYPAQRLAFMLADAKIPVVLTLQDLRKRLPDAGSKVVCMDRDAERIAAGSAENPIQTAMAQNLAYVIYTSGSTGQPKGVMVTHTSVHNLVIGLKQAVYAHLPRESLRVTLNAPLAFDASVQQLVALFLGHTLYVIPQEIRQHAAAFISYLRRHRIDVLDCVPSQLKLLLVEGLLQDPEYVPLAILSGGEAVDRETWVTLQSASHTQVFNMYGPTECTVDVTCCAVRPTNISPCIGRPLANTLAYVLDCQQSPVPVGVPGELHIGGDGLARGYLNRPELTAERFVANPFSNDPQARLYRTGDRVRYLPDGNIEFLGRLDQQVKVRGYRIEPGEIETLLVQHEQVRAAVVVVREDNPGDQRLVAYCVPLQDEAITASELRDHLKARLPAYLVPGMWVMLKKLPLTDSGKVDRAALPPPGQDTRSPDFVAPRSPLEETLAGIWAGVLGCERVGIRDNFFDLGGHSLLAVKMMSLVQKRLGTSLHLNTFWFGVATIESQAQAIASTDASDQSSRVVVMRPGGKQTPLFCVHTIGGGNLFHYSRLVEHLGDDRPVYGLQARGVDGDILPDHSVEAMAAYCIESLRTVQPDGPYLLCGYSSGGVVAFEMARQLQRGGQSRVKLFLIDSYHPRHTQGIPQCLAKWFGIMRKKQYRTVQERLYYVLLAPLGLQRLRRLRTLGESHRWALWDYASKPYAGEMVFLESDMTSRSGLPPHAGWCDHVKGGILLLSLPGTHSMIVHEPHVAGLARRLNEHLDDN